MGLILDFGLVILDGQSEWLRGLQRFIDSSVWENWHEAQGQRSAHHPITFRTHAVFHPKSKIQNRSLPPSIDPLHIRPPAAILCDLPFPFAQVRFSQHAQHVFTVV